MSIRHFIEHHFTLMLLIACAAGLCVPQIGELPDWSAGVTLGLLTFFACFKLRDGGFSEIRWRRIIGFYVLRYVLLPLALFAVARNFLPSYATAVFLLALVPTAVSSPAFAAVFGGHVASAFALVLLSTLVSPLLIPLQFSLIGNTAVTPDPWMLFKTLALCIFIPVIFYGIARHHRGFSNYVYARNKLIAIILVAFIIALVIAKQRTLILSDIGAIIPMIAINLFCFISFLLVGWYLGGNKLRHERITFATCSMFNNVALGVSLALLHFSADVILFIAASEMVWALLPAIIHFWLRRTA